MTPIANMIEKMSADGVPIETIVLAVRTLEEVVANGKSGGNPVDKTAEKRRAYDRERQAIKRMSGGNPVENPPTSETASSLNEVKEKEEAKQKRRNGKALPDDWHPSDSHFVEGSKLGKSRQQVEAKAEEMRLWARANGHRAVARKLDWDATFTGWMRRDFARPNGSHPGNLWPEGIT